VRKDGLKVKQNGGWREVGVEVIPLAAGGRGHHLILFHSAGAEASEPASAAPPAKRGAKRAGRDDDRVQRLEAELAASREYLQSIIQEVEAANEELQSANEEILSSNEELQSTNEELDTAKEELQSTNEELNTLNEELHGRNAELSRLNSDLVNLLASIQIAIVIVASDLRIRRFTPMAERFLNLLASDIGRPIGHIKPNIDCPDLEHLITLAIDTVTPQEREVRDLQGNAYVLRIRPYKNVENRIDGAVLALFDVQATKTADGAVRRPSDSDALFQAVPVPLVLLDDEMRIHEANTAFLQTFGYRRDAVVGRELFDLGKSAWKIPNLREHLAAVRADGAGAGFAVEHRFPRIGQKRLHVRAHRLEGADGASLLLSLVDRENGGEG
jgi:two-component system CheB/CheR fusion protein